MIRYPINPEIREYWKSIPIRVLGHSDSKCCNAPTILVQSRKGGFVTRNCSRCGEKDTFPINSFYELDIWISCMQCKERMSPSLVEKTNYGYICKKCESYIRLADILPYWEDLI